MKWKILSFKRLTAKTAVFSMIIPLAGCFTAPRVQTPVPLAPGQQKVSAGFTSTLNQNIDGSYPMMFIDIRRGWRSDQELGIRFFGVPLVSGYTEMDIKRRFISGTLSVAGDLGFGMVNFLYMNSRWLDATMAYLKLLVGSEHTYVNLGLRRAYLRGKYGTLKEFYSHPGYRTYFSLGVGHDLTTPFQTSSTFAIYWSRDAKPIFGFGFNLWFDYPLLSRGN